MNVKEWAERLNWREYREEMTTEEEKQAEADGMVIVFGASDDLIEFRGVIRNELGALDGGIYKMTAAKDVVPVNEHSANMNRALPDVRAIWSPTSGGMSSWASWEIQSAIPHETFDIMEDGELYCRGIVFAWADAFPTKEVEVDESLYPVDRPVEPANRWENPEQWAYIADWEENRADRAETALKEAADRAIAFVNNNYNAMGEWDDVAFDNLRAAITGGHDGEARAPLRQRNRTADTETDRRKEC